MLPQLFNSISDWRAFRRQDLFKNKSLGFVPTMGHLHRGHQSLLERCKQDNDLTLLSIFVNPTQFDNPDDFKKYQHDLEADLAVAEAMNIDFVIAPTDAELYPDNYRYRVIETEFSQSLEGQFRPGHFTGVLSVMLKLISLAKADRIYMGEKDYQQMKLIQGMIEAFFLDGEIIACPTIRDEEGLALSSRNHRLNPQQYLLAQQFAKILTSQKSCEAIKQQLIDLGFVVDYIEKTAGRRFAAVRIDKVRLIDNIKL